MSIDDMLLACELEADRLRTAGWEHADFAAALQELLYNDDTDTGEI